MIDKFAHQKQPTRSKMGQRIKSSQPPPAYQFRRPDNVAPAPVQRARQTGSCFTV
jgi:hypothetical protein